MQIVIGKLINGEFVIGKLEEKDGKTILSDVYTLYIQQDEENPRRLKSMILPMMVPFNDKAVKEISVDKFVLTVMDAPENEQRVYIKLTTGIDVVSAGTKIVQ